MLRWAAGEEEEEVAAVPDQVVPVSVVLPAAQWATTAIRSGCPDIRMACTRSIRIIRTTIRIIIHIIRSIRITTCPFISSTSNTNITSSNSSNRVIRTPMRRIRCCHNMRP